MYKYWKKIKWGGTKANRTGRTSEVLLFIFWKITYSWVQSLLQPQLRTASFTTPGSGLQWVPLYTMHCPEVRFMYTYKNALLAISELLQDPFVVLPVFADSRKEKQDT